MKNQLKLHNKISTSGLLILACLVFVSCRKENHSSTQSNGENLRHAVQNWQRSIQNDYNKSELKLADELINSLDYADSKEIIIDSCRTMVIKMTNKYKNLYLSLSESKTGIVKFEGIYLANQVSQVIKILSKSRLEKHARVVKFDLTKHPIKAWETTKENRFIESYAQKNKTPYNSNIIQKLPNADFQECLLIYWITWDVNTLEILSATYIGNTCDNVPPISFIDPGTGGQDIFMGGGESLSQACIDSYDSQIEAFNAEVNGISTNNYTGTVNALTVDPSVHTKPWNADWVVVTGRNNQWRLRSFVSGTLKRIVGASPGYDWAFNSMNHDALSFEGQAPTGVTITHSLISATPSFTASTAASHNILVAGMEVKFTVTQTLRPFGLCPVVSDFITAVRPPVTSSHTSGAVWNAN